MFARYHVTPSYLVFRLQKGTAFTGGATLFFLLTQIYSVIKRSEYIPLFTTQWLKILADALMYYFLKQCFLRKHSTYTLFKYVGGGINRMIGYSDDFHLEEYPVYFWFWYGKWILRLCSLSSRNLNFSFIKFSLVTYFCEPPALAGKIHNINNEL